VDKKEIMTKMTRKKSLEQRLREMKSKQVVNKELYDRLVDFYNGYDYNGADLEKEFDKDIKKEIGEMSNINQVMIDKFVEFIDNTVSKYYNNDDIEGFDEKLDEMEKAGIFLTKIIEASKLKNVTIKLQYGKCINCFGYELSRNVEINIEGNIGESLGAFMNSGKIQVYGVAGWACGDHMNNGEIIVYGNVNDGVGYFLGGGRIKVMGNAEGRTAEGMSGGELIINRNAKGRIGHLASGGIVRINGNDAIQLSDKIAKEPTGVKKGSEGLPHLVYKNISKANFRVYHKDKLIYPE